MQNNMQILNGVNTEFNTKLLRLSWHRGTVSKCKREGFGLISTGGIIYFHFHALITRQIVALNFATQHTKSQKLTGDWATRGCLPTPLYAEYRVKDIKNIVKSTGSLI